MEPLPIHITRGLERQERAGRLVFSVVGPALVFYMRCVRGHRLVGLERLRGLFREALARRRPLLVCANHLTLTDSFYLLHALNPVRDYLVHYERMAWNVAAIENFFKSRPLRALMYVNKVIAIDRKGTPEHQQEVLAQLTHLAARGQPVMIFPEGGRSRTGRVDVEAVTYGVGRILKALEDPLVLCVYQRGERQETWSDYPARGDVIHLEAEVLEPRSAWRGLRAVRDLSQQVIAKLKELEDRFFATVGTRG